jgi:hypothetical protein
VPDRVGEKADPRQHGTFAIRYDARSSS